MFLDSYDGTFLVIIKSDLLEKAHPGEVCILSPLVPIVPFVPDIRTLTLLASGLWANPLFSGTKKHIILRIIKTQKGLAPGRG